MNADMRWRTFLMGALALALGSLVLNTGKLSGALSAPAVLYLVGVALSPLVCGLLFYGIIFLASLIGGTRPGPRSTVFWTGAFLVAVELVSLALKAM